MTHTKLHPWHSRALRWAIVYGVGLWAKAGVAAMPVWIDADPAVGAPWREVDDAFALLLAFHSPELQIAGLSTTYGNANLVRTTAVAHDLVRRFGGPAGLTESAVYPGASSPRDGARRSAATEGLAQILRQRPLTYVALGPLTNLAACLELYPELAERIERVILVGGRSPEARFAFGPGKKFPVHDANVFKDLASVRAVLRVGRPLLLAPIELAPELAFTKTDLRALRASGATGDYLYRRTRAWSWFWTAWVREEGGLAFDVLGILPLVRPDLFETETRFAQVEATGDLVAHDASGRGRRSVQFGTRVRPESKQFILERLRPVSGPRAGSRKDSNDGEPIVHK